MAEKDDALNKSGPDKTAAAAGRARSSDDAAKSRTPTEQKKTVIADTGNKGDAAPGPAAPKSVAHDASKGMQADKRNLAAKKRRSKKAPENTECQNCGAALQGDYCHQCGQAAKEPRRLVIGLIQDVFVETLAIDGKLARTIALLLWRPGLLARRFLDGRRVRYSPPFRLYLFASVFFFFAAFWMIDVPERLAIDDAVQTDPEAIATARDELDAAREQMAASLGDDAPQIIEDGLDEFDASLAEEANVPPENILPAEAQPAGEPGAAEGKRSFKEMKWEDFDYSGPDWLDPHVRKMVEAGQRVVDDPRLFYAEMRQNLPRFLLLAPVIYGLTLTLLYIYRRKFFVYDHFIVALYMHAAIYAYLLLALLISRVPLAGGWLWIFPVGWGSLQPLLVLRQAYRSNWFSVWIKWFISTSIYVIALALIILLGLSFSLYQA